MATAIGLLYAQEKTGRVRGGGKRLLEYCIYVYFHDKHYWTCYGLARPLINQKVLLVDIPPG